MTSEGLGEMFEGDSADTYANLFSLMSMGGRAEGLACADPGARTHIGASGILHISSSWVKIRLHTKVAWKCTSLILSTQKDFFYLFLPPFDKIPEGFVVGIQIFARAPN